ncbi:MAG TPA: hypothetical protein VGS97_19690 [Actinocrinis sp.]|uniref:hypothetical protein n=1 Tax=Actinocrinis sp. TaxID=1920516 RepID=UPI002DDD8142|nr:hypothetical protein [Actinocrinis sp.]HEV2346332.1 hypothetical protein [Actinocrinis sp.]
MGFFSGVFSTLNAIGKYSMAQDEAKRLVGLSEIVACRQLKVASTKADADEWKYLISALDQLSTSESGQTANFAALLAQYAENLRDPN